MDRRTVELRVAGQSYRVVSSAPEDDLRRLAATVSAKLAEVVPPGKAVPQQALLLAAMALAHEVETERALRVALERKTRDFLRRALVRVDTVMEPLEESERSRDEPGFT